MGWCGLRGTIARVIALGALIVAGLGGVGGCYRLEELLVAPGVYPDITSDGVISSSQIDIRGQWYVYGDDYGDPKSCTDVGRHDPSQCSVVSYPPTHLPQLDFPNDGGKMCLSGVVAKVINCCTEAAFEDPASMCSGVNEINCFEDNGQDFSSMWGVGLGFDLDLDPEQEGVRGYDDISARQPWDAASYDVIGISFDLEWHSADDAPPLRVEFPMRLQDDVQLPPEQGTVRLTEDGDLQPYPPGSILPAGASTEEHPYGSPFWQEDGETEWKRSPIEPGPNTVLWDNVFSPPVDEANYLGDDPFPVDQMLGIQFHVIPDSSAKSEVPFSFCVSNLKFLTE